MEWERPPAKRPRSPPAEAGAPPPRARPWNPREDVTLALLAERGCFDSDTDETRLSVLASLPGRTVAECRERWTYFVCPMRYGVAARTPPSPWMASPPPPPPWPGPPPWATAPDGPPPAWAAPPYHQMPQMPHGPGPAEELRRVVADLAHHVQSLKQSIDRLNPPVPRVTHDDAADSAAPAPPPAPSLPRSTSAPTLAGLAPHLPPDPAAPDAAPDAAPHTAPDAAPDAAPDLPGAPSPSPPLPSPSVFGRGLADHGLPLPSPTGSPYVFAPRELEGIFLPPPEGGAALRGTPSRV